jgi:hypothetical protein
MRRLVMAVVGLLGISMALARPAEAMLTCVPLTVTHVWFYTSGALVASIKLADGTPKGWPLCNLKADSGVVTAEMCQEYRTALLLAKTTGRPVEIAFADAIGFVDCKDVPWDLLKLSSNLQYLRLNP